MAWLITFFIFREHAYVANWLSYERCSRPLNETINLVLLGIRSYIHLCGLEISIDTLRPRQDGRRFPDDTFERIFLDENVIILIKISLKFVPNGPINNIPALVQIMARRRPGDKPLSEPMLVILPTHICVTRPQWVKASRHYHGNHQEKSMSIDEAPCEAFNLMHLLELTIDGHIKLNKEILSDI